MNEDFIKRTHKDEPCEEENCPLCIENGDLEHLNPYTITDDVVLEQIEHNLDDDLRRNREASQPLYKRIGFKV